MKRGLALISLLLLLVACSTPPQAKQAEPVQIVTSEPPLPRYTPPPTAPDVDSIEIDAMNNEFVPEEIEVKEGANVTLIVTAHDMNYTFVVLNYGIDEEVARGKDAIITFTANKPGKHTYYSDLPGHTAKGTLNVI